MFGREVNQLLITKELLCSFAGRVKIETVFVSLTQLEGRARGRQSWISCWEGLAEVPWGGLGCC